MKFRRLVLAGTFVLPVIVCAEPSRCTLGEAKFMSWAPRERPWTLKGGLLHLDAKPDAVAEFKFTRKNDARFITSFPSGPGWRVSFKYRSSANATLALRASPMDSFGGQDLRFQSKALPLSDGWTDFCWEPRTSQNDYYGSSLSLSCAKGNGFVEIRDFSITDIAPEDKTGKPLLINGSKVREVCLYGADTPMRRLNDLRAAFMFRYALRAAGGEWIPIREVETAGDAGGNAVLVGRLAVDAGVVAASEQAKVEGLTGGWAVAAKGARLGLAGAVPCGVQRGAWRTLERLGIVYLGSDMFKPFPGRAFETGTFSEAVVPATAFPLEAKNGRSGHNAELRGTVSRDCLVGTLAIGAVPDVEVVSEDSLGYVVPVSEFRNSHPEYFALQSDGTRLTDDAHAKNLSHFCWTAPGLPELIASRYVEMMRALPEQPVWLLAPGDGATFNCKCENCKALGGDSDGLVRLANRVAELTSREFPGNIIQIYSYVDTPEPPKNPVRAHKNLNVGYCVYPSKYWPSGMVIPHPANEKGMNAMEGWRRECCPRLSLFGYFQQCPQWMHCWPGFDAAVWLTRNFSEHHSFLTWRWGHFPSHGIINECGSFTDLLIYVLSRLEVDPSQDERKLAESFIDWYYGVAAKPMRGLFDMAMAEPRRRDWVQTCEQRRKGLISREFADRAFPLLDEAERLAGDDEALKRRIRKQVIQFYWTYLDGVNRACGNVPSSDIEKWTGRVVRFVKACRDNGSYYFNWNRHKQWFHDNLMLDLTMPDTASDWTRAPEINRLIEDPKGVLAAKLPNLQQKTADGFSIPAEGMMGGEYKVGWKGRAVRRKSSGVATVITHLDLESLPTGRATMHLKGYDSDKEAVAEIAICVNDKVVYKGPVKFAKKRALEWTLELPDGLLKAGENEIVIINMTPDTEVDGEGGEFFRAKRDYYWGWFMINGLRFSFDPALRIVQWNIGHFAMGKSCDPTLTAEASSGRAAKYRAKIAELDADFLGVSEYDPLFDVAGTLATNAVFASFPTRIEGPKNNYQSNAVFSRLPCVRSAVVDFAERRQRTYFLDTVFRIGTNEVHFVQTHLDWNSSEEATDARPRQIRQMIDYLKESPYVIICADFNVYGAGEYYPFLMAGYSLANCGAAGCLDTVISRDEKMPCRRYPLDNIVVKGFEVGDVFLDDADCKLSDHRIIGCTLKTITQ